MTLQKTALSIAVTIAISSSALAAGPDSPFYGNIGFAGVTKGSITVGSDPAVKINDLPTLDCVSSCDEQGDVPDHKYIQVSELLGGEATGLMPTLYSYNETIKIHDAELKFLDIDLEGNAINELNSTGSESTLIFDSVTVKEAIIETNGTTISHTGNASAIEFINSTFKGMEDDGERILLENNNNGTISSTGGYAISVENSTIKGNINNAAGSTISGGQGGIRLENSEFKGAINNFGTLGNIYIGEDVTGKIAINLEDGSTTGAILTNEVTTVNVNGGEVIGDVDNDGEFNLNSGTITATDFMGIKNNGKFNQTDGAITANVLNNKDHKFNLEGGSITGDITNNGGKFNQTGGNIIGNISNNGSFNYKGGSITGNVNNTDRFYVEGVQTIDGDYTQTAGSTLVMGLHQKDTSLTANNINLAKNSIVLIDINRGNLYVQNGTKLELLKVNENGNITAEDINYKVVGSNLVTAGELKRNAAGNLEIEFTRSDINNFFQDSVNKGRYSQKTKEKLQALAAAGNARLADFLSVHEEAALLDMSGASRKAGWSASNLSNTQVSIRARGLASGDTLDNSGLWIQGLVSKGEQDNRNGEAYDTKSHGFVLGADTELNDGLVIGAAYSFIDSESKTANSTTDSDYHMATAYAAQALGQVLLDGQAYYAWGDNDSNRSIGATANYDSSLYGARVGAGYQFDIAPATRLVPTLSLDASRLSVDGYTESGNGALKVESQDFNRLELGLSTELSKDYQLSRSTLTPSVNVGAFHDFEGEVQNSTITFTNPDFSATAVTISGTKPEKTRYVAGVGLDIMSDSNLTVSAEYNYNWNTDGFDANSGALKFRWDF